MNIDFKNRTVLITGATRGIGKAIAEDFRQSGVGKLLLTGTNESVINELNNSLSSADKNIIEYLQVDFSNDDSIDQFLKKLDAYPAIDVLVNNAGVNKIDLLGDTSTEDYDLITKINMRAPYLLSKELSNKMKENGFGRIVNVASIWSEVTKPGRSLYTMTKTGLVGLTKTSAVELAAHGVLVNSVSPGFTLTELTKSTLTKSDFEELQRKVPINRFAEPHEVSKVVLFLASELNTYLTGQNIIVDGGFTII